MAQAVCRLVQEPRLREAVGRQARKHIQELRSLDRLISSLASLYVATLATVPDRHPCTVGVR